MTNSFPHCHTLQYPVSDQSVQAGRGAEAVVCIRDLQRVIGVRNYLDRIVLVFSRLQSLFRSARAFLNGLVRITLTKNQQNRTADFLQRWRRIKIDILPPVGPDPVFFREPGKRATRPDLTARRR
jgi:hypothetical protein